MTRPEDVIGQLQRSLGPVGTATALCHPWALTLARKGDRFVFRAQLVTRGSTVSDWHLLGRLAALVGAPDEEPASILSDPGGVHTWTWVA